MLMRRVLLGGNPLISRACSPGDQRRTLMTKELYDIVKKDVPVKSAWPYKERSYTWWSWFEDPQTTNRFDENTKLILVEGNIGSGKSTMAKYIAEKFGLYHMKEFSMDDILVSSEGIDRREHYANLPKCYRWPDVKMFYENPRNPLNAKMQDLMFYGKCEQYLNALAHIMNTGQGVVMERSPHSDFVFTNAMKACGYLSDDYFRVYHNQRRMMMYQLEFWPHMVIYLDTPVGKCMQNIKARGLPHELDTGVLNEHYLGIIEESYKDLLPEFKRYSELLVYDWEEPGDFEQVAEDLELVNLDFYHPHFGDKFLQWMSVPSQSFWWQARTDMTTKREIMSKLDQVPKWDVAELYEYPEDREEANLYCKHLYGKVHPSNVPKNATQWYNLLMASDRYTYRLNDVNPWFAHWYKDQWQHDLYTNNDQWDYHGEMKMVHDHP